MTTPGSARLVESAAIGGPDGVESDVKLDVPDVAVTPKLGDASDLGGPR